MRDGTTLFPALNVLKGTVLGRRMQRHRHQEFIRFLNAIEAAVPAGRVVYVILDNFATHKHPTGLDWASPTTRGLSPHPLPRAPGRCGGDLLRRAHEAAAAGRRVLLDRGPPGCNHPTIAENIPGGCHEWQPHETPCRLLRIQRRLSFRRRFSRSLLPGCDRDLVREKLTIQSRATMWGKPASPSNAVHHRPVQSNSQCGML